MTTNKIEKMKYAVKSIERLNKKVSNLHTKIAELEKEMASIEGHMQSGNWDAIELPETSQAS